jgi:hypothetical protein
MRREVEKTNLQIETEKESERNLRLVVNIFNLTLISSVKEIFTKYTF